MKLISVGSLVGLAGLGGAALPTAARVGILIFFLSLLAVGLISLVALLCSKSHLIASKWTKTTEKKTQTTTTTTYRIGPVSRDKPNRHDG